jgi:hypothetical protein
MDTVNTVNIITEQINEPIIEVNNDKSNSIISSDIETDLSKNSSTNNEIIISSLDNSSNSSNGNNNGDTKNDDNTKDNINDNNDNTSIAKLHNIQNNCQQNEKNESIIKYINNTLTFWDEPNDISNTIDNKSTNTLENILDIKNTITNQPLCLSIPKPPSILLKKSLNIQLNKGNDNDSGNNNNDNDNDNDNDSGNDSGKDSITNLQDIQAIQDKIIKQNVVFSSSDCNKVKSFDYNSNSTSQKSFRTQSEVSYELFNKMQNNNTNNKNNSSSKNIRLSKYKNKQPELDEVDYLYNKLQDFIRNINIDRTNYIIIIVKAIEIIENYNGVYKSDDKKNIVIKAFNRLILIDLNLCEYDQTLFLTSIINIIEIIITFSKNKSNKHNNKKYFLKDNENIDDIYLANLGQIIYSIIDKITTIIIKKQYNADKLFVNIGTITNIIMVLVDKYLYLTGSEKKIIVLQVINTLFKERIRYIIEISEEKQEKLTMALDKVPMLIDILIAVQKGKYKINRKQILETKKSFMDYILCREPKHI